MDNKKLLQDAIAAIRSGDKETARQLLLEITGSDPNNENAWLWMTQVVSSKDERIKYLQNVLRINPNNESAKRGLAQLQPQSLELENKPELLIDQPPIEKPPLVRPLKSLKRETIKKCPYCAEIIKIEAKICRFCGRDLAEQPAVQITSSTMPNSENRQLLEQEIARFTARGWQIVNQTDTAIQLKKPKEWSQLGLTLAFLGVSFGLILLLIDASLGSCLFSLGIILLILSVIDYLAKKEKTIYFTVDDIKAGNIPRP